MTMSYCCNLSNILCNLTGAEIRFLRQIISSGLWSLSTTNDLPYRYVWNFSQPNTMANSSHSMFAYLVSVSIKLLLAKAMGLPSCKMQAPRPLVMCHTVRLPVCFCHNTLVVRVKSFQANLLFSGSCRSRFGPMRTCSPSSTGLVAALCDD